MFVNYNLKLLHIAINDPAIIELIKNNGLIYNPIEVFKDKRATEVYYEFFQKGKKNIVSIITEQGPGELAKELGLKCPFWVGGIIAPFNIDEEKAKNLLEELIKKPEGFLESKEKNKW